MHMSLRSQTFRIKAFLRENSLSARCFCCYPIGQVKLWAMPPKGIIKSRRTFMKHLNPKLFILSFFAMSLSVQAMDLQFSQATAEGGTVKVFKMSEFELRLHLKDENLNASPEIGDIPGAVSTAITAGQVWVIGKKIYDIVKENEAVLNVNTDHWSVLPEGVELASKLEGWSKPEYSGWVVNYENLFGMNVARVSFLTAYNYGGSFEGRGKYLANVTIIPRGVHTLWGYTMDMDAEAFGAVNEATREDPVVGLSYHVRVRVGTIMKKSVLDFQYYLSGNGELQVVPVD